MKLNYKYINNVILILKEKHAMCKLFYNRINQKMLRGIFKFQINFLSR